MGGKQSTVAGEIARSVNDLAQGELQEMVAEQVMDLLHEREALGQSLREMINAAAAKASKDTASTSNGITTRLRA